MVAVISLLLYKMPTNLTLRKSSKSRSAVLNYSVQQASFSDTLRCGLQDYFLPMAVVQLLSQLRRPPHKSKTRPLLHKLASPLRRSFGSHVGRDNQLVGVWSEPRIRSAKISSEESGRISAKFAQAKNFRYTVLQRTIACRCKVAVYLAFILPQQVQSLLNFLRVLFAPCLRDPLWPHFLLALANSDAVLSHGNKVASVSYKKAEQRQAEYRLGGVRLQ